VDLASDLTSTAFGLVVMLVLTVAAVMLANFRPGPPDDQEGDCNQHLELPLVTGPWLRNADETRTAEAIHLDPWLFFVARSYPIPLLPRCDRLTTPLA